MTDRENPPVSTGGGDDGTTTLLGAGRIPKSDVRIIVLGDVDEASSFLGLARTESEGDMAELLVWLQRLLYRVMGDVAMPDEENVVGRKDLEYLDSVLEEWHGRTEIPKEFVVPGETKLGALLDVACSVVSTLVWYLTIWFSALSKGRVRGNDLRREIFALGETLVEEGVKRQ